MINASSREWSARKCCAFCICVIIESSCFLAVYTLSARLHFVSDRNVPGFGRGERRGLHWTSWGMSPHRNTRRYLVLTSWLGQRSSRLLTGGPCSAHFNSLAGLAP